MSQKNKSVLFNTSAGTDVQYSGGEIQIVGLDPIPQARIIDFSQINYRTEVVQVVTIGATAYTPVADTTYCVEIIAGNLQALLIRYKLSTINLATLEATCRSKKIALETLLNAERYTRLPSIATFSKILPLIHQLPSNEQQAIFKSTPNTDAWR